MNRAWIPAGALASVSVAGLIALGPLTDSLNPPVNFHPTFAVTTPDAGKTRVVPVSVNYGTKGTTNTNAAAASLALTRGGAATTAPTTNSDAGTVGFHKTSSPPSTASATVESKPKVKPKTVKRQNSIGAQSGPNGDNGLASGGSGSGSNVGAQSGTPGSDGP
jgi:hypothetical protein